MTSSPDVGGVDRSPSASTRSPSHFIYEHAVSRGILGRTVVCASLGFVFLALRWLAVGSEALWDWSLLLAVMISTSAAAVYYATRVLDGLVLQLAEVSRTPDGVRGTFRSHLTDVAFVAYGVLFGTVNAACGALFGTWPAGSLGLAALTLYGGFFLVGFICGFAVAGIHGVIKGVRFSAAGLIPDPGDLDGCGGFLFLGTGLVKFASVTLMVGVLISIYILNAPWTHTSPPASIQVRLVEWIWVIWPFALSALVLAVPAFAISAALRHWKDDRVRVLSQRIRALGQQIEGRQPGTPERATLQAEYEFEGRRRVEVYSMRVWPLRLGSYLNYAGVVVGHLVAAVTNVVQNIHKLAGTGT
jgi:hypothetical protein